MNFRENNKPIYLQIVDRICDDIVAGLNPPGSRLPSVREYAAMVQVNANTLMRAYEFLSIREIITNKRGIGFFVCDDAKKHVAEYRRETFFNNELSYFFSRLHSIGVTPEQLAELYDNFLKTNSNEKNY